MEIGENGVTSVDAVPPVVMVKSNGHVLVITPDERAPDKIVLDQTQNLQIAIWKIALKA